MGLGVMGEGTPRSLAGPLSHQLGSIAEKPKGERVKWIEIQNPAWLPAAAVGCACGEPRAVQADTHG